MIGERGVSYYGVMSPVRARQDFEDMTKHGCNTVLLAVSEFDWWFWRRNVSKIVGEAHGCGLRVYVDLWGWGKTLAGEPPSIYLMRDLEHRQRSASGKTYHAVCMNDLGFRRFLIDSVAEMISETGLDGLFLDEPHYANWHDEDWACTCPVCRNLFMEEVGKEMPTELTRDVVTFREEKALEFLGEISKSTKDKDPDVKTILCLLPTESPLAGITDWRQAASLKWIDVIATDPYWYHAGMDRTKGLEFFRSMTVRLLSVAESQRKGNQLWLQAFRVPRGREAELGEAFRLATGLGVESVFAWPYKGGEGSILESDDPAAVWEAIGKAYRGEDS